MAIVDDEDTIAIWVNQMNRACAQLSDNPVTFSDKAGGLLLQPFVKQILPFAHNGLLFLGGLFCFLCLDLATIGLLGG